MVRLKRAAATATLPQVDIVGAVRAASPHHREALDAGEPVELWGLHFRRFVPRERWDEFDSDWFYRVFPDGTCEKTITFAESSSRSRRRLMEQYGPDQVARTLAYPSAESWLTEMSDARSLEWLADHRNRVEGRNA